MTRPLLKDIEEKELRRLQAHLINTSKKTAVKVIALTKKEARSLANLLETILTKKPVVVDAYLTPNEAAKISGVSRPLIIEMLKHGSLIGHMVGKHWRVKKESLIDYIANRDKTARLMRELDKEGLAFDK